MLTKNFSFKEATEWANHHNMSEEDKALAIKLANEAIDNAVIKENVKAIAVNLQIIRGLVNAAFPEFKGKIGIKVLSWVRHKKWEIHRNRTGTSQHTKGHAVDFILTGCGNRTNEIMKWLFNALKDHHGGLAKLERNGVISFIHIDLRGFVARWEY